MSESLKISELAKTNYSGIYSNLQVILHKSQTGLQSSLRKLQHELSEGKSYYQYAS